jgi:hypothetical protein
LKDACLLLPQIKESFNIDPHIEGTFKMHRSSGVIVTIGRWEATSNGLAWLNLEMPRVNFKPGFWEVAVAFHAAAR